MAGRFVQECTMSSDVVIQVEGLTKSYRLYSHPRDRLLELVLRRERCQRMRLSRRWR